MFNMSQFVYSDLFCPYSELSHLVHIVTYCSILFHFVPFSQ